MHVSVYTHVTRLSLSGGLPTTHATYLSLNIDRQLGDLSSPVGGTRWRSWLRYYATSQKVAGSILDEVIGFFKFT
jgi:hypothetical protein